MSDLHADLQAEVERVLLRYATGIDRKDWDLLGSCFTQDVDADYGGVGRFAGRDAVVDFMRTSHEPLGHTLHRITNVVVEVSDTGATARSYVDAVVMLDARAGVRAVGWYDDRLVRAASGWQIAARRFTHVLLQSLTDEAAPAPDREA